MTASSILDPMTSEMTLGAEEAMRDDFAALLEKSFSSQVRPAMVTVGEVIRIERDGLLVDVGGKAEGFVPMKEIPGCNSQEELQKEFKPGQVTEFYVLREVDTETPYLLSIRRVADVKSWDKLNASKENNEILQATVVGLTKGGILATVHYLKGFIPASQLRVAKPIEELVGDTLPVKVLEVDRSRNKLILSHRVAVFEQKASQRLDTLGQLSEGQIVEGEVVKVTDFGVFVDINGIDGLLPLSEITWRRIKHPSDVLQLGQQVRVQVLTIDMERQRISLSLKRMEQDPWDTLEGTFEPGVVLESRVSKLLASGVLVELVPGVEAYCPYENHNKFYKLDQEYTFEIISMAIPDRRITLAYRGEPQEAQPAPVAAAAAIAE